jgi:urea transport system substrate-binding protein
LGRSSRDTRGRRAQVRFTVLRVQPKESMKNLRHGRNKVLFLLAAALLVALLVALALGNRTTHGIKIGVLYSLSGTMAVSEKPIVDAVMLAVEEANQTGGVDGARIETIVTDCRSDDVYCAQQAERLITHDGVQALFGCSRSGCLKAVKPVVEKHHSLLFYPGQDEGLDQSANIVYTGAAPNQQIIPMVNWAMQQRGKRAYLIGSDDAFPRAVNQIIKKLLLAQDGQLVAERYAPLGERNLDASVREIVAQHPDFVVNTLSGDSNLYLFRALQKRGVRAQDIPVFSTNIAEAELAVIGPEVMAGHYAVWNYFQSIKNAENRSFVDRFRRRFGKERVLDDPMEASYIGVRLWVNAMRAAKNPDVSSVKTILARQTLSAPEGIVAVDASSFHLWKQVRIGIARADAQFEIIGQSGRSIAPAPLPFFIPHTGSAPMVGVTP